jgi:hypothetical protein
MQGTKDLAPGYCIIKIWILLLQFHAEIRSPPEPNRKRTQSSFELLAFLH